MVAFVAFPALSVYWTTALFKFPNSSFVKDIFPILSRREYYKWQEKLIEK